MFVRHKILSWQFKGHTCTCMHTYKICNTMHYTTQHNTHTLTHWLPCKWTSEQGPPLLQLRSLRKGSTVLLKLAKHWWHFRASGGLTTDLSAPEMMGLPKGMSGLLGCTFFRFYFVYKYLNVFCASKFVFGTLLCVCACFLDAFLTLCIFWLAEPLVYCCCDNSTKRKSS